MLLISIALYAILQVKDKIQDVRSEAFQNEVPLVPKNMPLPQIDSQPTPNNQANIEQVLVDLRHESRKINDTLTVLSEAMKLNSSTEYKLGCRTDDDCNTIQWDDGKKNICRVDHTCACESGSGPFCTAPAKYKDPSVMTQTERGRFKYQNDLSAFTARDYANWLLLYKDSPEELTRDHLKNLQLLLRGQTLPKEIPARRESPPQSVKQYLDLLDAGKALAIKDVNLDSGVYLPSNYTAYEKFLPPKELTTIGSANPDIHQQRELSDLFTKLTPQILPKVT